MAMARNKTGVEGWMDKEDGQNDALFFSSFLRSFHLAASLLTPFTPSHTKEGKGEAGMSHMLPLTHYTQEKELKNCKNF
jgi:hypothetical protein